MSPASPLRSRAGSERGASIVEVLVSVFVLSIGVLGALSLLVSSSRAAGVADVRSAATDLAAAELETIRSLDYEIVGISIAASGYVPDVDGRPTVTEATNAVEPLGDVVREGTRFSIQRSVVWETVGAERQAFKIVSVVVSWDSTAGRAEIELQTGLHPGLANG